jgi:hypothetical protein
VYHDTSSTLDRLRMRKSVTLYSPLSITQARHRLSALVATDLVIPGSGFLAAMNDRRYEGHFDGSTLQLRGPFGNRKLCLLTAGQLEEDGDGVALQFVLRMDRMAATLAMLGLFSCLLLVLTRSLCLLPMSLFMFTFLYVGLLIHYFTETATIENVLENTLSARYEKAEQDGVSAHP